MIVSTHKKQGYKLIELRQGINGSGNTIFILFTKRITKNGKTINRMEYFKSKAEAENWIEWIL